MGCKVLHLGVFQPGDWDVSPTTDAYVAGQPLKVNTSGKLELCKCYREGYDDGYVGLAKGFSGNALNVVNPTHPSDLYNGKATFFGGHNMLKLDHEDPRNTNDIYPYDRAQTYNEGDDLYIGLTGLLTNIGPDVSGVYRDVCPHATPIAVVMTVASSYLEIYQVR